MAKSISHAVSSLNQYHTSGLGLILVSWVDTVCDTDLAMYYSLFTKSKILKKHVSEPIYYC